MDKKTSLDMAVLQAPFGNLYLYADKENLWAVSFQAIDHINGQSNNNNPILEKTISQLDEFIIGERCDFDLPLKPQGTKFQQQVWQQLQTIPYGDTQSYQQVATAINNPKAVRAVGNANNKNPFVVVVPCHRVIGSTGKLVGYGGGLNTKEWLLNHEQNLRS